MEDELKIRTSRDGTTATVAAAGEIDLSTVDELRSAVTGAADDVEKLLLDLTGVEFIDSAGLGGLLELRSTLRSRNVTLEISADDGPVRQAMEITGLSELLARLADVGLAVLDPDRGRLARRRVGERQLDAALGALAVALDDVAPAGQEDDLLERVRCRRRSGG